ncbi:MAG: polyketide synthase dehydratase domain-containing protein [Deltaproteobacteria bacterium]|nr:polyketide synthase dehydratase domain-containing protein [Deltaproteobacteria bacterium]MCL5277994.1 polyketide synthase dehydratase domain-containing protein [Deltaproteobacteria bacterium]
MRIAIQIQNRPYLADHRVGGRSVYPAAESLERLARAVAAQFPGRRVLDSRDAEFLRFLPLSPEQASLDAIADIETEDSGDLATSLGTVVHAPRGTISRIREHARVTFSDIHPPAPLSIDSVCAGDGVCYALPAERLYQELVPFGPSFHNAGGTVFLFRDGAVATLKAPRIGDTAPLLGSPFILDAAFHVACAWGQRYHGYVAFPVGYTGRKIIHPAVAGEVYFCRVVPGGADGKDTLRFDIWIYDAGGELCEVAFGVKMKNIFQDRMGVPEWVKAHGHDELRTLGGKGTGMSVVELTSILPFAGKALSRHETEEEQRRCHGKRNRYRGARIALKRLARILYKTGAPADPSRIETIAPDNIHPACIVPGSRQQFYCSAAHDDRFAVAVGGDSPIGVDVERLNTVLLRGAHIYMMPAEQDLCARSPLGEGQAAIRAWTTKECAAKVFGMSLPAAWSGVALKEIAGDRSIVSIRGRTLEAAHASVGDHVFTVLEVPEP